MNAIPHFEPVSGLISPSSGQPNAAAETTASWDAWMPQLRLGMCTGTLASAESAGVVCLAVLSFIAVHPLQPIDSYVWLAAATYVLIWAVLASSMSLYSRATLLSDLAANARRGVLAAGTAFGLILLFGFTTKQLDIVSRAWFLTWMVGAVALVGATRSSCFVYLRRARRRGACIERALVMASSWPEAATLAQTVAREGGPGVCVIRSLPIPGTEAGPSVEWVEQCIRNGCCRHVFIGGFETAVPQVRRLLERLVLLAVDVTVIPNLTELRTPVISVSRVGTLTAVSVASRPVTASQAAIKRAEDLVLASLALVVLAPFLGLIWLVIKLDSPGPALFVQERQGYNGRVFRLWKFRTMHIGMSDQGAVKQTSRSDPRVTRSGRILRRTSFDELPQLFNVLRGDMSVVGPRPHALGMTTLGLPLTEVLTTYSARHRLRPGITGWAQVQNNRGAVETEEKLRHRVDLDCEYIDRWSLSLDLWILFRTLMLVINDRNAY